MIRLPIPAALGLLVVALAGCGGASSAPAADVAGVSIAPTSADLFAGEARQFTASAQPATALTWTADCGTVSASGLYTAPGAAGTCHVTVRVAADSTLSATAEVRVTAGTVAAWRPFSADSPWNTPIAAGAALDANSAALIADLAASSPYGASFGINIASWSVPLYQADASTPTFDVKVTMGGAGWPGTNGMNGTAKMPIPAGATPDPQSDHHMAVVDRAAGKEWGCSGLQQGTSGWVAGVCATADLNGTGVRPPLTTASPWYLANGARACGFPLVAGLIRPEEIAAGRIDHALVLAYPHIRAGFFTPPASTAQDRMGTDAIRTRGIPCGGRVQLDPAVNLDALGLTPAAKVIARALQDYGAYVGDYSGGIALYADGSASAQASWSGGVLAADSLWGKLDLTKLRVIQAPGTLYDAGNGY